MPPPKITTGDHDHESVTAGLKMWRRRKTISSGAKIGIASTDHTLAGECNAPAFQKKRLIAEKPR